MMKNIVLTNETAQVILGKVDAFRGDKNKLQLKTGIRNMGDGLASQVTLVNGGMMAEIGFKTANVPDDYVAGSESYFTVNVNAGSFISYLKALLPFNANILIGYDEQSTLYMQVGSSARVSIPTFEEMDALLPCDQSLADSIFKLETKKFMNALRIGSFTASAAADSRGITDRVVLRFTPEQTVVYSTDCMIMNKAWSEIAAQRNCPKPCLDFLNSKLEHLAESDKNDFQKKFEAAKADPQQLVGFAESQGYQPACPWNIALPAASVAVLKTLFGNTESLNILITPNHMVLNSGNVRATFSLAGKASEVYEKTVDPWEKTTWTGQAVVDKEELANSLAVVALSASQLGGKKASVAFHTSFQQGKMILTDRLNNKVALPLVHSTGDLSKVSIYLDVEKVLNVLGKLANGNVVLRYFVSSNGRMYPVSISNGDVEGKGTISYTYILPVNIKKEEEEKKKEETNADSKANDGQTKQEPASVKKEAATSTTSEEDGIPTLGDAGIDDVM